MSRGDLIVPSTLVLSAHTGAGILLLSFKIAPLETLPQMLQLPEEKRELVSWPPPSGCLTQPSPPL